MKKIISIILLIGISISSVSWAQDYNSCIEKYQDSKQESYFNKLPEGAQASLLLMSGYMGFITASSLTAVALPAFIIAGTVATTPIVVGTIAKGIKNAPINKMIGLINESDRFLSGKIGATRKAGRRLRKLQAQLGEEFSFYELAKTISEGNKDLTLCEVTPNFEELIELVRSGEIQMVIL